MHRNVVDFSLFDACLMVTRSLLYTIKREVKIRNASTPSFQPKMITFYFDDGMNC
jgi:hypothetical protein